MKKYWQKEQPIMIKTSRNTLRWFKNAEKLHVALPEYQDGQGELKPGKTVVLDIRALLEADKTDKGKTKELLSEILSEIGCEDILLSGNSGN
jgi:hypothetical protein